jgi:hypothetical protein
MPTVPVVPLIVLLLFIPFAVGADPVAGLPTCWLPVWVSVVCWLSKEPPAAKLGAETPLKTKVAMPRAHNVFFIRCSCSQKPRSSNAPRPGSMRRVTTIFRRSRYGPSVCSLPGAAPIKPDTELVAIGID